MKERGVAVGGRGGHLPRIAPELLILAGGFVFALLGRGRWANLTEDHGFWFSAVQGLLSGGRAMHEVRVQYGPVSLWIMEGLCRVFGTSAATLVAGQFAIGLAGILGVQIFARQFLGPVERWLSAAILVVLIVWMVGPGNLLYPCAFAISHALFLAVAVLLLHDSLLRRGRWQLSVLSGGLAAITMLTKQEFGVAAALGIAVLSLASPALDGRKKAISLGASGLAFIAVYSGILEIARDGDSLRHLVESNVLWPWVPVPAPWRQLFRRYLGLDAPGQRLREAADAVIGLAAFGGTIWLLLHFRRIARKTVAVTLILLVWALWAWRWTEGSHFLPMTLALPAILGSAALFLSQRQGQKPQDEGVFLALALGALVLLQREGYRGGFEGYYSGMGYVLAVPVVVPLLWWLARSPRTDRRGEFAAAAILFSLSGYFGLGRLRALERGWANTVPLETDRGRLYVPSGSAPPVFGAAEFIRQHTRPGDPILILPSAMGLDFMLDRKNLALFPYVSPGFLTTQGERELIDRCAKIRPRAVLVFEHAIGVLRAGDFGRGFAESLMAWLTRNLPAHESFAYPGGQSGIRFWMP